MLPLCDFIIFHKNGFVSNKKYNNYTLNSIVWICFKCTNNYYMACKKSSSSCRCVVLRVTTWFGWCFPVWFTLIVLIYLIQKKKKKKIA